MSDLELESSTGAIEDNSSSPVPTENPDATDSNSTTNTSDHDVVNRRSSSRLKISALNTKLCLSVTKSVESLQACLLESQTNIEALNESDILSYLEKVNAESVNIESLYSELSALCKACDITINDTINEMLEFHKSEAAAIKEELQALREEIQLSAIQEEAFARFKQLKTTVVARRNTARQQPSTRRESQQQQTASTSYSLQSLPATLQAQLSVSTQPSQVTVDNLVKSPTSSTPDQQSFAQLGSLAACMEPQCDESHSRSSSTPSETDSSIRQLADCITQSIKQTKRTVLEPTVFKGNPLEFADWEQDFESFLESQGVVLNEEKIRYLKNYLAGDAKEVVSGHLSYRSESSYKHARMKLKDRFGRKIDVARAMREKLDSWPTIRNGDNRGLQRFADYLDNIKHGMVTMTELAGLDSYQENEKIVDKLPDWLARKWAAKVHMAKKQEGRYPLFSEFADFVAEEADLLTEPVLTRRIKNSSRTAGSRMENKVKTMATSLHGPSCTFCAGQHRTSECEKIFALPYEKRVEFVKSKHLCFRCIRAGHGAQTCRSKPSCSKCSYKGHPTILHKAKEDWKSKDTKQKETDSPDKEIDTPSDVTKLTNKSTCTTTTITETDQILSMVLPVRVSTLNKPNREVLVYAMVDTMSDHSYISKELAAKLHPKGRKEKVTVGTMIGESGPVLINKYLNLSMRGYSETERLNFSAFEWDDISCNRSQIPTSKNVLQFPHLQEHASKLPPLLDIPVGLLIGRNCSDAFLPLELIKSEQKGQPFAQRTPLGWFVLGGDNPDETKTDTKFNAFNTSMIVGMDENTKLSQDDLKFLEIMDQETRHLSNGFLEMPLPFKSRPVLPNNRAIVEKRFVGLRKKLSSDSALKKEYEAFMDELIAKGHAEPAPENSSNEKWYIPHFAVRHPKKNKIRVVFDCSAKFEDTSLNDQLLQGPDMMNSLLGILCRFRLEPIAIACDVEKMFYNFYVQEQDRDYLRFLWYDKEGNVKDYRMTVHLFGASSSPAVATYGLRKLADAQQSNLQAASEFIRRNFYVDDGIISVKSASVAKNLIQDARELCARGNLRLHKFISNNKQVLDYLPESERLTKTLDLCKESQSTQRTLGLEWAVEDDCLAFKSTAIIPKSLTRRGLLSVVSQLFDPLGLLAPFTLVGKNILQLVNKTGIDWDEEIDEQTQAMWKSWTQQLSQLDQLHIPRCVQPAGFNIKVRELHHFCDASTSGIGACSYIRLISDTGEIHTSLILAKSKVVPSKGDITIPKLELQGALLATQLSNTLSQEIDTRIDQEYFWTDSTIVLGYLANETKRFKVYVANRVREIRQSTDPDSWHHVPGSMNPADLASRGMDCQQLNESEWFRGPEFLQSEQGLLEVLEKDKLIPRHIGDSDPEVVKVKAVKATSVQPHTAMHSRFQVFSSYQQLRRSIAHLQSMVKKKRFIFSKLSPEEVKGAEDFIIQTTQQHYFQDEIRSIKLEGAIPARSKLAALDPFIDDKGILRVGGRVKKSCVLNYREKHPIILPKEAHLSQLIIQHYHDKTYHQGRNITTGAIRTAGFWIVGLTGVVRSMINRCVTCRRLRTAAAGQKMGYLPKERVEPSPAFTHVGIDCFGPFLVKDKRTESKRWGLLFSCMYSRAIHIEVLEAMSSDAFINALRNFICLRGEVSTIFSDNGTNFLGARNEFLKGLSQLEAEHMIEFKTNSPYASHQGGTWERQIRTARAILSGIATKVKGRMDTPSLRTAMYEVMAIMNSRPLTVDNLNNPQEVVLTPNHLLTSKTKVTSSPPGTFNSTDMYSRKVWRRAQQCAELFWMEWRTHYLKEISKRPIWKRERRSIKPGDVVILDDNDLKRNEWKLGIVEDAITGGDGLIRKARVRLANKHLDRYGRPMSESTVLERPAQKMVVLLPTED